jgi:ketosteroid isomerase-like protein
MNAVSLFTLALLQVAPGDLFSLRTQLQGLYDEISQATFQFDAESDIDDFHAVLYTPDWTFVDTEGRRHSWPEMRQQAVNSLSQPQPDSMQQVIQKLSFVADGATVVVTQTTTSTIVDGKGQYGRKGASHTLATIVLFRDDWVGADDHWRLKSRAQLGPPRTLVDAED